MSTPRFDTILITGAAGRLGSELRRGLAPLTRKLRLSDRVEIKAGLDAKTPVALSGVGFLADGDTVRVTK